MPRARGQTSVKFLRGSVEANQHRKISIWLGCPFMAVRLTSKPLTVTAEDQMRQSLLIMHFHPSEALKLPSTLEIPIKFACGIHQNECERCSHSVHSCSHIFLRGTSVHNVELYEWHGYVLHSGFSTQHGKALYQNCSSLFLYGLGAMLGGVTNLYTKKNTFL